MNSIDISKILNFPSFVQMTLAMEISFMQIKYSEIQDAQNAKIDTNQFKKRVNRVVYRIFVLVYVQYSCN